jgi:hypothetical protein
MISPRRIRAFRREDIPAIVDLRARAFARSKREPEEEARTFEKVFFDNPWRDEEMSPLVYVGDHGRPIGFLGVVPRPATFRGEPVRMAVTSQFMVDPEARGVPAVELFREFFAGSQDLSYADFSSEVSRRLWMALGGETVPIASLSWSRPLAKTEPYPDHLDAEPLTPHTLGCEAAEIIGRASVAPVYDERSAAWLLDRIKEKCRRLQSAALHDGNGRLAGLYVWRESSGRSAQVIQLVARRGKHAAVFEHFLADASARGMVRATGRATTAMLESGRGRDLTYNRRESWTIAHTKRSDLLASLQAGDATLSLLDGEWWMDF